MGERRLTVQDRIIIHLAGYIRYAQEFECPEEMSQAGISKAIDKSRAHTTLELSRMKESNLVTERLAHVKNAKSKRKTYNLTAEALTKERQIAEHIESLEIEVNGSGGFNLMNGKQVTETLLRELPVSRAMAFDIVLRSSGIINMDDIRIQQKLKSNMPMKNEPKFVDHLGSISDNTITQEKDNGMTMDAHILKANILSKKSHPEEALEILEAVINANPSNPAISRAHYSRASIFRKQGDFSSALKEINKSMAMVDEGLIIGRCQMEKAMILYGSGNSQKSLELLDLAQKSFQQENSQVDTLRCGINRGVILKGMENIQEAIDVLESSLALAEKTSIDRLKAYALVNLTDLLNEQKKFKRSRDLAMEAKNIFLVLEEPLMLAASLFNLGTAQAGLEEKKEAMVSLDNAISILEKNEMLTSRTSWLERYASILEELGEPEKAKLILNKI